jgi:tetratricopeptide (TPR) repeat protein
MRDLDALYHDMAPEEVEEAVAALESEVQVLPTEGRSAQEIERLFEYMQGLNTLNRHAEASQVFLALRGIIDDYRARHTDALDGLEYFFEWSMLALKLTTESRSTFVSMPLYYELLETFDDGPVGLRYRGVLARGQLTRHIEFWLSKGGNLASMPEEDQAFVQAARDDYENLHEAAIDDCIERDDNLAVVRLYRNAAQFFLLLQKPNDAIACLKEAVEYLPDTPEYHPTDKADMLLQIGQIFVGYTKYEISLRYFDQAFTIYEAAGDDFEIQMYQVEGWIEEAKRKMGK